jgi:alpha-1,3-fucosyltransferase
MNATLTYRPDSDFYNPYGIIRRRKDAGEPVYIPMIPWRNKTKSVVWLVSNCKTASKREIIVNELAKYIDVDIFGGCGKTRCNENSATCLINFSKKYKFYLSFENSLCKSYVTEKLYRALSVEIIPIVFGGANYTKVVPHVPLVNVKDFRSPLELARYLQQLGQDSERYYGYFNWKAKYHVVSPKNKKLCSICEALTDGTYKAKRASNTSDWWQIGACDSNFVYRWRKHW